MHDVTFTCMGARCACSPTAPEDAALDARAARCSHEIDARLSRFRADSELSRLNADPRATVPASPLLRAAVAAAQWAAERTGGLVDPTLLGALEAQGYTASLAGRPRLPLAAALPAAPPRRAAAARGDAPWRR